MLPHRTFAYIAVADENENDGKDFVVVEKAGGDRLQLRRAAQYEKEAYFLLFASKNSSSFFYKNLYFFLF